MPGNTDSAVALASTRRTRQRTKQLLSAEVPASKSNSAAKPIEGPDGAPRERREAPTAILPDPVPIATTKLSRRDQNLLLRKQTRLRKYAIDIRPDFQAPSAAIDATLVFAQEEAGTAVCISHEGLLLTCAHCVVEAPEDLDADKKHWLLFATGRVVAAECIAWGPRRDLALLRVVAAQRPGSAGDGQHVFSFARHAEAAPGPNARLVCVGHPRSEDLEADEPGVKTKYDVLHLSAGAFRGCAEGQDLQDNSEIGALQHDCWTYWGHSGAPLLARDSGELIGLHSPWDDETAMRRGIPLEVIREFIANYKDEA